MLDFRSNILSRLFCTAVLLVLCLDFSAQEKPVENKKEPYDKKEEIIYDGKRYRLYNNYMTIGAGFLKSSIRSQSERILGIDYHFHIRRQYFQTGVMMSGPGFGDNNNIQCHLGYGYRIEKSKSNLGAFIGPSYSNGVEGMVGTPAEFYDAFGLYASVQAITKFTYDIGIGLDLFGDISYKQHMFGVKIIVFFSGAYKGEKRNYNPHVHSENPQ